MKASLILILLLLFLPAGARTEKTVAGTARVKASSGSVLWPEGALVNVYFVRDMFSADEKQALQETMESWTKGPEKRGAAISFVFQGETGGLIDCEHCLTISRQGFSTIGKTEPVVLNVLRQDGSGRLLSAWIAVERVAAGPAALRNQLLQALERELEINNSQTAKNGR
jgi:hypothetical protein